MIPRGIRNHNPGNLVTGIQWDGLAQWEQMNTDQQAETRFCVFRLPVWGIRAMAKVLKYYHQKRGLITVKDMLDRYAPDFENDTNAYTRAVAAKLGVTPTEEIQMNHRNLLNLVTAIISHENGWQPYTWEIQAGVILAGLEPQAVAGKEEILYR